MAGPILPPLLPGSTNIDVPVDFVPPDDRRAVATIREDATLVRPLVVKRVASPLAVFERLLDDLPAAARLVDSLRMGRYRIEPHPDGTVEIDDEHGARARVARLVVAPGMRVYRATGAIEAFPAPPLRGTGIVTLRYEPGGDSAVWTGGQIFFRLESDLLHRIARPFLRLLHGVIDVKVRALVNAAIAACEHEADRRDSESSRHPKENSK
ncbi:MAG TPA: hypothetical protein VHF22_07015 [Planctomycetota bacterium]|nr:hypothetical protein [Planctomycetota bacterium]